MTGIEERRMRRRPMRSMVHKAIRVKVKLVRAMERDVRVGDEKPRREKIVAEKYIREFWSGSEALQTMRKVDVQSHRVAADLARDMRSLKPSCSLQY